MSSLSDKKIRIQSVIVISCVIFLVLMITALIINLVRLGSLRSREKQLAAMLAQADAAIAGNEAEISYRQSQEYLDWYAREYLNMQGDDEITFIGK